MNRDKITRKNTFERNAELASMMFTGAQAIVARDCDGRASVKERNLYFIEALIAMALHKEKQAIGMDQRWIQDYVSVVHGRNLDRNAIIASTKFWEDVCRSDYVKVNRAVPGSRKHHWYELSTFLYEPYREVTKPKIDFIEKASIMQAVLEGEVVVTTSKSQPLANRAVHLGYDEFSNNKSNNDVSQTANPETDSGHDEVSAESMTDLERLFAEYDAYCERVADSGVKQPRFEFWRDNMRDKV